MSIFDGYNPKMTDATVPDPDYSEADLQTIEPEENAVKDEKDQVDFEESGTEALAMAKMQRNRLRRYREDIRQKVNKLARLHKALKTDGRLTASMRTILMEEEIIGDSADEDAKDAAAESSPEEIADKGASEEELAKASLRAQYRAYKKMYQQLRNI